MERKEEENGSTTTTVQYGRDAQPCPPVGGGQNTSPEARTSSEARLALVRGGTSDKNLDSELHGSMQAVGVCLLIHPNRDPTTQLQPHRPRQHRHRARQLLCSPPTRLPSFTSTSTRSCTGRCKPLECVSYFIPTGTRPPDCYRIDLISTDTEFQYLQGSSRTASHYLLAR